MFTRKTVTDSGLDAAIKSALDELNGYAANEEKYAKIVDQLETLYKLRETQKPERVSRDTLALVIGNLLGIVVIVGHERAHVVTSKALNFVMKSG